MIQTDDNIDNNSDHYKNCENNHGSDRNNCNTNNNVDTYNQNRKSIDNDDGSDDQNDNDNDDNHDKR